MKRHRLPVEHPEPGMYVVELDRPEPLIVKPARDRNTEVVRKVNPFYGAEVFAAKNRHKN